MIRSNIAIIPAVAWAMVLFFLSWKVPGINIPERIFDIISTDKFGHAAMYAIYFLLIIRIFKLNVIANFKLYTGIIVMCSAYGLLMELFQYLFFPGRYFEFLDIVANIFGSVLGMFIFILFLNFSLIARKT